MKVFLTHGEDQLRERTPQSIIVFTFIKASEMRITIAIVLNVIISIIYLLGLCLINKFAPIVHPNVAYGLTMIAWTSILFVIQFLLLLLLLFFGRNKFNFFIPLIIPCVYELSIFDVYPKRSFVWLFILLVLYICYYLLIMKYNLYKNYQ